MNRTTIWTLILSLVLASAAGAAPTPEQKCWAWKSKVAGKYSLCLQNAFAKYATNLAGPKLNDALAKCAAKYDVGWETQDRKAANAGTTCFDGDAQDLAFRNFIDDSVLIVQNGLTGQPLQACGNGPVCGDGTVESPEACDVGNLNGATCTSAGFAGGALRCATGCTLDTSGCYATRWVNHGDGTATDNTTGLQWELKNDNGPGDVHDKDNPYTWTTTVGGATPNGTAFTAFLGTLNGGVSSDGSTTTGCFAGKCDWRLPTIDELRTLLAGEFPNCGVPCTSIPGSTQLGLVDFYWSSSTHSMFPGRAWEIYFWEGVVSSVSKDNVGYARAVRGGS